MPKMIVRMLGPTTATTVMITTRAGNERTTSVKRMISASTQPAYVPAMEPSTSPMVVDINAATNPTLSDTCPANSIRLSTSRPAESVPNGWIAVGRLAEEGQVHFERVAGGDEGRQDRQRGDQHDHAETDECQPVADKAPQRQTARRTG